MALRMGSRCSTSWIKSRLPNWRALSRTLRKALSRKLVTVILQSLDSLSEKVVAWINDQWVVVVSFEHDHIFRCQVVNWPRFELPDQMVVSHRKVFREG